MCQSYRNPALLAKMAATLQVLSQGRLILGVGAGWKEDEYRAFNYPFPPMPVRQEQLIDTLEILKQLWTQTGNVTYEGKHYSVNGAPLEPKPHPLPPIIVGGGGDRTLRIAAQYADWWNLYDANARKYQERAAILKQQCEAIGRDPASIRLTWFGRIVVGRNEAEMRARGTARQDITFTPDNSLYGTPNRVAEQLAELIGVGVSYFMPEVIGLPHPDVFAMLLDEILPALK
jgi:alkanesulfonate monooxygenase SsuD/methylene tetrahydromethanopterin reductase-like flavin-dependent oxidoreductase (luciferase family)